MSAQKKKSAKGIKKGPTKVAKKCPPSRSRAKAPRKTIHGKPFASFFDGISRPVWYPAGFPWPPPDPTEFKRPAPAPIVLSDSELDEISSLAPLQLYERAGRETALAPFSPVVPPVILDDDIERESIVEEPTAYRPANIDNSTFRSIDTPAYNARSIGHASCTLVSLVDTIKSLDWEPREIRVWITRSEDRPRRLVIPEFDEAKMGIRSVPSSQVRSIPSSDSTRDVDALLIDNHPGFGWAAFAGRIEGRLSIPVEYDGDSSDDENETSLFNAVLDAQESAKDVFDTLGWDDLDDVWVEFELIFDGFDYNHYRDE